ncbi:hypothetical protein Hanom_Chr13g01201361 [Helianthus anomalus]
MKSESFYSYQSNKSMKTSTISPRRGQNKIKLMIMKQIVNSVNMMKKKKKGGQNEPYSSSTCMSSPLIASDAGSDSGR